MFCDSHPTPRPLYSPPPCPSLAASTAAYRRRSFSDNHPKNRCIFCSISAEYPSMPHSLIQNLLRGQDTTAQAIREVILDHILKRAQSSRKEFRMPTAMAPSPAVSPRGPLTARQRACLEQIARRQTSPQRLVRRAKIL